MEDFNTAAQARNGAHSPNGVNDATAQHNGAAHDGQPSTSIDLAYRSIASGNAGKDLIGAYLQFPYIAYDAISELHRHHFPKNSPEGLIVEVACQHFMVATAPASKSDIKNALESLVRDGGEDAPTALHAILQISEIEGGMIAGVTADNVRTFGLALSEHIKKDSAKMWRRFNFVKLAQVLTRPDPEFLVDRLLTVGGTSLLTAKHKNFKSFIALDIGLSVATGNLWHGYEVQQGAVIYIAAEGASGLKKRAAAWLARHDEIAPDDFIVLDIPLQIPNPGTRRAFIEEIAELKPVLIILDTLARCSVGLDENSAGDIGQFADALAELARETGAHVMAVHHNNKGGEYRGSSAVPAAVDTHLSMERNGESVTLKTEKQKDFEELHPLVFESESVTIPDTGGEKHSLVFRLVDTRIGSKNTLSEIEEKILEELTVFGEEGAPSSKWENACKLAGIPERTFYRSKPHLLSLGAVRGPKTPTRGARYFAILDWCHSLPLTAKGDEIQPPESEPVGSDFQCEVSAIAATHCQSLNSQNIKPHKAIDDHCHSLPLTAKANSGSVPNLHCHSLPPPFKGGSDGSDGSKPEVTG